MLHEYTFFYFFMHATNFPAETFFFNDTVWNLFLYFLSSSIFLAKFNSFFKYSNQQLGEDHFLHIILCYLLNITGLKSPYGRFRPALTLAFRCLSGISFHIQKDEIIYTFWSLQRLFANRISHSIRTNWTSQRRGWMKICGITSMTMRGLYSQ